VTVKVMWAYFTRRSMATRKRSERVRYTVGEGKYEYVAYRTIEDNEWSKDQVYTYRVATGGKERGIACVLLQPFLSGARAGQARPLTPSKSLTKMQKAQRDFGQAFARHRPGLCPWPAPERKGCLATWKDVYTAINAHPGGCQLFGKLSESAKRRAGLPPIRGQVFRIPSETVRSWQPEPELLKDEEVATTGRGRGWRGRIQAPSIVDRAWSAVVALESTARRGGSSPWA